MKVLFSNFKNPIVYNSFLKSLLKNDHDNRYHDFDKEEFPFQSPIKSPLLNDLGDIIFEELSLEELIIREIENEKNSCISKFEESINSNLNYTSENISHLANKLIIKLNEFESKSGFFKNKLIAQHFIKAISNLQDYVFEYLSNPYPKNVSKIDFNLNRSSLTYFFYVLREKNVIKRETSNAQIARFLQFMTRYLDEKETHQDVKGVASLISDFGSEFGEKSEVNAAEALEDLFDQEGFFIV